MRSGLNEHSPKTSSAPTSQSPLELDASSDALLLLQSSEVLELRLPAAGACSDGNMIKNQCHVRERCDRLQMQN